MLKSWANEPLRSAVSLAFLYRPYITKYNAIKLHAEGPMNTDIKCIIMVYSKAILKFFLLM